MKTVLTSIWFLILASASVAQESLLSIRTDEVTKPRLLSAAYALERKGSIPMLEQAPSLDGVLTDGEWKDAAVFTGFTARDSFASSATLVRAGRTATHLYVAFRCALPVGTADLSMATKRDGDVWQDESVEIFLDPGRTKKTYFVFIVNTLGTKLDGKGYNSKWDAEWEARVKAGRDEWVAEIAIPLNAIGTDAPRVEDVWGVNFTRNDKRGGQHSSWSRLPAGNHDPANFGMITFTKTSSPLEMLVSSASKPADGAGTWEVCCVNRGDAPVIADVDLVATRGVQSKPESLNLPPGISKHTLPCSYAGEGEGTATVRLKSSGAEVTAERVFWKFAKPAPLRLQLCESESFLDERTLQARFLTECEPIADLMLKVELWRNDLQTVLRTSSDVRIPGSECRVTVLVADLPVGGYALRMKLLDSAGKVIGEDSREFTRSAGPFDSAH